MMTAAQVDALKPGDVVVWNDPDDGHGLCTRAYTIKTVWYNIDTDIITIETPEGDVLEAFAEEIEKPSPKHRIRRKKK